MQPIKNSFIFYLTFKGHPMSKVFFIECFTTTFLHTNSWLTWVDEDDEVGVKEKPEDTRHIKKIAVIGTADSGKVQVRQAWVT